jgi:hypothetical protein
MYVCMYVCMYVYVYITRVCVNIYIREIKCRTRIYVHMSTHLCVYVHVYMCSCRDSDIEYNVLMSTPNEERLRSRNLT